MTPIISTIFSSKLVWLQISFMGFDTIEINLVCNFYQWVQNWFWKQEIELSKQEMELSKQEIELYLLFPDHWSNNFFYKMFLNFINEVKAEFENRK